MTEQRPPSITRGKYALQEITSREEFLSRVWLLQGWTPRYRTLKRALDLLMVIPLLGVAAITLPFIALAICLDSRGPVFYRQERVGRDGTTFRVLKYR